MGSPPRVNVRFRGRSRAADPARPLLEALVDDPFEPLQRSIRYHRPRGAFCGLGYCTQCLVRVNGDPNVRACQYRPREGDVVEMENAWPSPRLDLLSVLDFLFPRGIDTLHGFRRPAAFTPLYHRVIRRLAGYGKLPTPDPVPSSPGERLTTDVLIVGGGVAGSAAAAALAGASAGSVLVDDAPVSPNEIARSRVAGRAVFIPAPDPSQPFPFRAVVARQSGVGLVVAARFVLLAPGGYDAPLLFPGNDRPGIVTADGAERLRTASGGPPFAEALIFGGDDRALQLLERFPNAVKAVASFGPIAPEVTRAASDHGIRLYPRVLLTGARGRTHVRAVTLRPRGGGPSIQVPVDAVILAHRRLPNAQLLFQAGARMHWDSGVGHYLPDLDGIGQTTVPGLLAAGEVAGFCGREVAEESGRRAANTALYPPAPSSVPTPSPDSHPHALAGYYRELLSLHAGGGKCIVCPCEDVLLEEVEAAHRAGYRGIEVIKRYTGVGTGLCQGRYCVPETLLLLSLYENRPPREVGYLTQRPPVVPVPLALLARLPPEE